MNDRSHATRKTSREVSPGVFRERERERDRQMSCIIAIYMYIFLGVQFASVLQVGLRCISHGNAGAWDS